MPTPDSVPIPSVEARRLLDRYGEAERSWNGKRARDELAAYIAAIEAENARLRGIVVLDVKSPAHR